MIVLNLRSLYIYPPNKTHYRKIISNQYLFLLKFVSGYGVIVKNIFVLSVLIIIVKRTERISVKAIYIISERDHPRLKSSNREGPRPSLANLVNDHRCPCSTPNRQPIPKSTCVEDGKTRSRHFPEKIIEDQQTNPNNPNRT